MLKLVLFALLIVFAVLGVLSLIIVIKPYTEKIDCIALYTGGNGSGKSLFSCHQALVQLKKNRFKAFLSNINIINRIKRKPFIKKPILLSNIPIKISPWEWSTPLTFNPFVMQEKLPEKCVCFIDEVNLFLSQMDFKVENEEQINTSITLFRHFTKGGYLILNTQNVNKVHWIFRYCANRSYNLCEFRKPILGLPILAWVKCRHISIGDDIKTVEEQDVDEGRHNMFLFFPCFGLRWFSWYDTYVYSDIVSPLPYVYRKPYKQYKRNSFMKFDLKHKYPTLIDTTDEYLSCGGAGSEQDKPTLPKKHWKRT